MGLRPARLRRRSRAALPDRLRASRATPATLAMWRQPHAVPAAVPRDRRRAFAAGDAPPCIVVYVDAWTAYGGSQFVDSPGTGRYHSYLCDEVVPFVDARYRTLAAAAHRGDQRQVERRLRRDDHADAAARPVRRPGQPRRRRALRALLHPRTSARRSARLRDDYDGSYDKFWDDFRSRAGVQQGRATARC